jgi:hypothetical protein
MHDGGGDEKPVTGFEPQYTCQPIASNQEPSDAGIQSIAQERPTSTLLFCY